MDFHSYKISVFVQNAEIFCGIVVVFHNRVHGVDGLWDAFSIGPLCEGAGERKRDWGRESKILFSPSVMTCGHDTSLAEGGFGHGFPHQ